MLQQAGFKLALDKSDTVNDIAQSKEYLGFILDSTSMTVHVPDSKLTRVQDALAAELSAAGSWRKAKEVASTVGRLIALEPALGPVVQLLTRVVQRDLLATVEIGGWSTSLKVSTLGLET